MFDILQKPDRELNLWPISSSEGFSNHDNNENKIEIIGLSPQYSVSQSVEIQVKVNDPSFDCGDLYITIHSSGKNEIITQGGFFTQCFDSRNSLIPVGDEFSTIIETPGSYRITADVISKDLVNTSTSGTFTVK